MNDVALPEQQFRELALFAGAGGGILGGHLLGWKCVCAVEYAAYPRSVLLARQRDGMLGAFPIWDDVRSFNGKPWKGHVDVVSGGFPCQDISVAGRGDGLDGERSGLWTQMARIIGEVQPRFCFVENSPMLTSRGLDRVLADLSTLGFDAEWGIVGADDAGAPHRRERIWILAYAGLLRCDAGRTREPLQGAGMARQTQYDAGEHPIGQLADPLLRGCVHRQAEVGPADVGIHAQREPLASGEDVAHAELRGVQHGAGSEANAEGQSRSRGIVPFDSRSDDGRNTNRGNGSPGESWWAVEPGLGRVANGVADRMDRLKAIGNGQVSTVAALAWHTLLDRINKRNN